MNTESLPLVKPRCHGMEELPSADAERAKVTEELQGYSSDNDIIAEAKTPSRNTKDPLFIHLSHGLAYTTGSALGSIPPSTDACLEAFSIPNVAGLSAGARAWSKHFHRSIPTSPVTEIIEDAPPATTSAGSPDDGESGSKTKRKPKKQPPPTGWWGSPTGPVATINEKALALFWKIVGNATWKNLHWLPHQVLVYEVRVLEGYGMRWSQDRSRLEEGVIDGEAVKEGRNGEDAATMEGSGEAAHSGDPKVERVIEEPPWVFRGFVEPMMENGHETGWKH